MDIHSGNFDARRHQHDRRAGPEPPHGFYGALLLRPTRDHAIGAYVGAWISASPASTPAGLGLPFILAIVGGGAAAGAVSYFIGRISINLKGDYFCIATLGFGEAIRLIFNNVNRFGGARGWPGVPSKSTFLAILIADTSPCFSAEFGQSRHGRNMIAARERARAQSPAITFQYKIISSSSARVRGSPAYSSRTT